MPESESAESDPSSMPPRSLGWRCWVCAGLLGLMGFWAYTRNQSFPFYYHSDEPSKAEQLIRGELNFHHPLLLLDTTEGLMWAAGTPHEPQPVVERGRTASAIFAGLSIAAMVVLAWQLGGAIAGVLAGMLTLTHPVLFELSHYMKEDCALLVGLTWTAAGLVAFGQRPTLGRAILVGAAGGLAASGKLLGLVMTGSALLAVGLTRRREGSRWAALAAALLAAIMVFGAVNVRVLWNVDRAASSLSAEVAKIETRATEQEQRNEGIRFKHLRKLGTTLSVPLLLGMAYWNGRRWQERGPAALRVLGCFVVVYFLIVSLSPKTKDRYVLPVYVLACGLGAAGLWEWTSRQPASSRWRWAGPVLAVVAVGWHLAPLISNWRGFTRDDRRDLTSWLRANVPPTAVIAQDTRAHLEFGKVFHLPGFELPNPILTPDDRRVSELGSLSELRARKVAYVVACEPDYHGAQSAGRAFYDELFAKYKLVWERPAGPNEYLNPGLKVFDLR